MDPREDPEYVPPKLPFRRLKYALDRVVSVAIPLHIQLLNEQSERLEQLADRPLELRSEQLKASNTVKLLKQDLFELEDLNRQVREEDQDKFQEKVEKPLRNAIEVLSCFMSVHSDVLGPLLDLDNGTIVDSPQFPDVVCDLNAPNLEESDQTTEQPNEQLQVTKSIQSGTTADAWSYLRKELVEIHSLIRQFSTMVFGQKEHVDSIENNILQARENVREGTEHLKKASLLKAASFPIAGAIIGGAILGPIGALVGLKVCMVGLASGSALGYTAGRRIKKRQQNALEGIEMKALTYPSKASSEPDLTEKKTS